MYIREVLKMLANLHTKGLTATIYYFLIFLELKVNKIIFRRKKI